MFTALTLAVTLAMPAQPEGFRQITLLVLKNAPNRIQRQPEVLNRMQAEHLQGLEKLYKERKALLVGPVEDKEWRGIAILDTDKPEVAKEMMKNDPFIKTGDLIAEYYGLWCVPGSIKVAPKFLDIEPLWFGLYVRGENPPTLSEDESKKIQEGHIANLERMAADKNLFLAGPFENGGNMRGVLVMKNLSKEQLDKELAQDPAVNAGRLTVKWMRFYTGKGQF